MKAIRRPFAALGELQVLVEDRLDFERAGLASLLPNPPPRRRAGIGSGDSEILSPVHRNDRGTALIGVR